LTLGKVQVLEREKLLLYYDLKIAFVADLYSSIAVGLVTKIKFVKLTIRNNYLQVCKFLRLKMVHDT
jgi:hypothetical protein